MKLTVTQVGAGWVVACDQDMPADEAARMAKALEKIMPNLVLFAGGEFEATGALQLPVPDYDLIDEQEQGAMWPLYALSAGFIFVLGLILGVVIA